MWLLQPLAPFPLLLQVQQVSQEQLEKELADRQVPLIIDFYATWCGPCVLLAKELEQVATSSVFSAIEETPHCLRTINLRVSCR